MINEEQFKSFVRYHGFITDDEEQTPDGLWQEYQKRLAQPAHHAPPRYLVCEKRRGNGETWYSLIAGDEALTGLVREVLVGEDYGWSIERILDLEQAVPVDWELSAAVLPDQPDSVALRDDRDLWYHP